MFTLGTCEDELEYGWRESEELIGINSSRLVTLLR